MFNYAFELLSFSGMGVQFVRSNCSDLSVVITHIELESFETPPKINSNNRPLVRPNSDTIVWILSLFTLVSGEDGYYIESKVSDRKGQISTIFQLTRFDLDFI